MYRWLVVGLFGLAASALAAPLLIATALADVVPQDLLIYYGWPSAINGTYDVAAAAAQFAAYDYVVLGDGLEDDGHPDHANTIAIITAAHAAGTTRFFGYIDLGVTTQDLSLAAIASRVDAWQAAGADGIFFDDFGYDFAVPRPRQIAAVDHAHARGLPVIANGWVPDDVFGSQAVPVYNPDGLPTSLGADDFYLSESFQITEGSYQSEAAWYAKVVVLDHYRDLLGFGILSVTTNDAANLYDPDRFFYAWYSALLCGHEATGWGEYAFAAVSCSAPFRARPAVVPGTAFVSAIIAASPRYRRWTDAGGVVVDTADHTYAFTPGVIGVNDEPPAAPTVTCAPNPFNPATTIWLDLPRAAPVTVEVISIDGRRAATLVQNVVLGAGRHAIPCDGQTWASGTYLVRVIAGPSSSTAKIGLLR